MGTQINNSVVKVFEILKTFNKTEYKWSALEISKKTGMHIATVHRFLLTLETLGVVVRAPDGKFQLGLVLLDLGNRVSLYKVLADTVAPFVDDLVQIFRETVHVAVLEQGQVVYVYKGESPRSLKISTYIGKILPAYNTGVGKVLLAGCTDAVIKEYIRNTKLVPVTKKTITSPDKLLSELIQIKSQGYSIDSEENEEGLSCVAVPIKNESGETLAAISVSGPTSRINETEMDALRERLSDAADDIQKNLFGIK